MKGDELYVRFNHEVSIGAIIRGMLNRVHRGFGINDLCGMQRKNKHTGGVGVLRHGVHPLARDHV